VSLFLTFSTLFRSSSSSSASSSSSSSSSSSEIGIVRVFAGVSSEVCGGG
jgi:hypothetical protein